MTLIRLLAFDKWARLLKIISKNGGLFSSFYKLWRFDALKEGKFMGVDKFGNSYYENQRYMLGESRWVEYNPKVAWDYNGSQVTPEWYGWLHYKTDRTPCEDCAKCCTWCNCWILPHKENVSGTPEAYYPYTTTRPNIYVWDGHSIQNRPCMPMQ